MKRWLFIAPGVLLVLGAAAVLVLTLHLRVEEGRFGDEAVETRGTVKKRHTTAPAPGETAHHLTITYRTPAGERLVHVATVPADYYTAHRPGSTLRLRYRRDAPGHVVLTGLEEGPWRHLMGGIAAAALAAAGAALINRGRHSRS